MAGWQLQPPVVSVDIIPYQFRQDFSPLRALTVTRRCLQHMSTRPPKMTHTTTFSPLSNSSSATFWFSLWRFTAPTKHSALGRTNFQSVKNSKSSIDPLKCSSSVHLSVKGLKRITAQWYTSKRQKRLCKFKTVWTNLLMPIICVDLYPKHLLKSYTMREQLVCSWVWTKLFSSPSPHLKLQKWMKLN